jgi:hypothetical protein
VKENFLTIDQLKESVSFDPDTGVFTWIKTGRGVRTGKQAGSVDPKNGYRVIMINGVDYYAQRLAWFYVHGVWPKIIRFQNENHDDCSIKNLCEGFMLTTKYDHKTKEGRAASQKEYRSVRREKFQDDARMRTFGITRGQYGDMLLAQGGCCAICRQPETATRNGLVKALAVDHCHTSGEIRGLLCVACNTGIGKFKDNRDTLLAAIKYLDKHSGVERVAAKLEIVRNS